MFLHIDNRTATFPISVGRWLMTLILLLVAISNIAFPLIAQHWRQFATGEPPIDLTASGWGQDGLIVVCILLLFVARALARGKRQAWLLSIMLFAFSLLDTLIEKAHWFSIATTSIILVLLLICAPIFSVRSDTHSFMRGYGALFLSAICLSTYGAAIHLLARGQLFLSLLSRHDVLLGLRVLCFLALWYGVIAVLRPVDVRRHTRLQERLRARTLICRYGKLALAHFTLSHDKRYFWSETGNALIAYRVAQNVALVLSDPIGPEEEQQAILAAFLAFCHQQDWRVVFYQASSHLRSLVQAYGLHTYKIGEEAVVEIDRFTLQGKCGADVRHAIARARRGDVTIACWQGMMLPENLFAQLQHLSARWMKAQNIQGQYGFSMGNFPEDWSPELLTAVAFGPQGEVQAFLTWTPMYAGEGWALDNMRRAKETVPGTMEYLLAESIAWAKARGYKYMSLGLAPLAGLATTTLHSSSLVERSAAYLHQQGALLGQYRSLYAFKTKFQPRWEDRYLIVDERQSFPRILLALAQVHGCGTSSILRTLWSSAHSLRERIVNSAS